MNAGADQAAEWPRVILLADMNAFFASVEQVDHPLWRGRPIALTNGDVGTCIITCSYEARAYGVRTGMRLKKARRLCPELIQCPARPERYAATSTAIMEALQEVTPDIEVFSVDEAFDRWVMSEREETDQILADLDWMADVAFDLTRRVVQAPNYVAPGAEENLP